VRALEILQQELAKNLGSVHSQRLAAVWRTVAGLMLGGRLWLTALGRDLPGSCRDKHRIKAVDRLVGSKELHSQIPTLYRALAGWLLRGITRPVVLVDGTGVGPGRHVLTAALSLDGRALPIYSQAYLGSASVPQSEQRKFLNRLAQILPAHCTPILVTDAGFHSFWFHEVLDNGWHFVCRMRRAKTVLMNGQWVPAKKLHGLAGRSCRDLGNVTLFRSHPETYRAVLSKAWRRKGRKRLTSRGTPSQRLSHKQMARSAKEPWLLVTSLKSPAKAVVDTYAQRMQIEQAFRDLKNHRHGWSLEDIGCRSNERVEVLLVIAALANVAIHLVGIAAERSGLQRTFQANTVTKRRLFSLFFLARLVIAHRGTLAVANLQRAKSLLLRKLSENVLCPAL
jgi:hypothetical protein